MAATQTARKTAAAASRKHKAQKPEPVAQDAIELLIADHREVERLYKAFEAIKDSGDDSGKMVLAEEICLALRVHTQIEEELFYPAVKKVVEQDQIDEAVVEHAGAKTLIGQIESMEAGEDLYDAKVHVLWEQVEHHVKEEEGEMFPEVRESGKVDLAALGKTMAKRKEELTAELAGG